MGHFAGNDRKNLMLMVKMIIITGGPGSGKSSLIAQLSKMGFATVAEASRILIKQESKKPDGMLPWRDMAGFARLCQQSMLEDFIRNTGKESLVFFDRALPDIVAYLQLWGLTVEQSLHDLIVTHRYYHLVFWCGPWPDIYVNDPERPQSYQVAERLGLKIKKVYENYGYEVLEVPKTRVKERVKYIVETLENIK